MANAKETEFKVVEAGIKVVFEKCDDKSENQSKAENREESKVQSQQKLKGVKRELLCESKEFQGRF